MFISLPVVKSDEIMDLQRYKNDFTGLEAATCRWYPGLHVYVVVAGFMGFGVENCRVLKQLNNERMRGVLATCVDICGCRCSFRDREALQYLLSCVRI